jgi:hypothetical protein
MDVPTVGRAMAWRFLHCAGSFYLCDICLTSKHKDTQLSPCNNLSFQADKEPRPWTRRLVTHLSRSWTKVIITDRSRLPYLSKGYRYMAVYFRRKDEADRNQESRRTCDISRWTEQPAFWCNPGSVRSKAMTQSADSEPGHKLCSFRGKWQVSVALQ